MNQLSLATGFTEKLICYKCLVVNAADIPTSNKETTNKTDPMDSRKIVKALRAGTRASPGYVSGISYSYQGMVITGTKLGNDSNGHPLKTQLIMNKKEIAQQFTPARGASAKAGSNVRSKSTFDKLRTANKHAQGNRANAQQGNVQYRNIPDSISD